jgi:hypothetical protein
MKYNRKIDERILLDVKRCVIHDLIQMKGNELSVVFWNPSLISFFLIIDIYSYVLTRIPHLSFISIFPPAH